MADFNFITTRLATGAALQGPEDVADLAVAGITDVIDCRAEFDDAPLFAKVKRIHYLWDGTADDGEPKPPLWFSKGIEFGLAALARPKRKVYCHCAAGVNRGPSMAYAILRSMGFSSVEASTLIRSVRPQVGIRYAPDADKAVVALGYA